jgi:hypothetical protein
MIATDENPMKIIVLLSLVIAGCILVGGCIGQIKPADTNVPAVTPANTFIPFSNETSLSNNTNSSAPPPLKGLLKISVNSWIGKFPVSIDNMSVGVVETTRPLTLMVDEGNHTIDVCCGVVCERENITIRFGEQRTIDFSERLKENCEFLEPTVRIIGYFLSGDQITVNVEFINPTTQPLVMSAEVSCGYSYIESRSNNRVGNLALGQVFSTVNAGDRVIKILNLYLASGYSYDYEIPTITKFSSR